MSEHVHALGTEALSQLRCLRCRTAWPVAEMPTGCPTCLAEGAPSSVVPEYDRTGVTADDVRAMAAQRFAGIWRWAPLLPVVHRQVSLREGETPLLHAPSLGHERTWLKDERRNPTGSFKDRFFAVCISRAVAAGAETVVIASSGNGGVSAAAYAAAAGLRCVVITSPGIAPAWRVAIELTGADLIATATDKRWDLLRLGVDELGWYPLTNFINPPVGSNWYGVEGYKTMAYEIAEERGWIAPDWVVVPASRGDALSGIWRGFVELHELGVIPTLPQMAAVERFPSLVNAWRAGADRLPAIPPEPTAAVSIGSDVATYQSLAVVRESEGLALAVNDTELFAAANALGRTGVFCEVSSAAGVAGLRQLLQTSQVQPDADVVVVLTATGFTDPGAYLQGATPLEELPVHIDALRALG